MSKKRKSAPRSRSEEIEIAKQLGKHVSTEKAAISLAFTFVACLLPIILGLRLWEQIPELMPSGLIGTDGKDDSLPRWVVVFGLPGLMAILNLIAHGMLRINQKHMTIPPTPTRLVGRWGFSVISVLFCSGMIFEAIGQALPIKFLSPCIIGLLLLVLGGHVFGCDTDTKVAIRVGTLERNKPLWDKVHFFAGILWQAVAVITIAAAMLLIEPGFWVVLPAIVALFLPVLYAKSVVK